MPILPSSLTSGGRIIFKPSLWKNREEGGSRSLFSLFAFLVPVAEAWAGRPAEECFRWSFDKHSHSSLPRKLLGHTGTHVGDPRRYRMRLAMGGTWSPPRDIGSTRASFIENSKACACVDCGKLWAALKEMDMPQHLTVLMRNLYCGQEAAVRTEYGETGWFPLGKDVRQGCI
ncbi:uncharacterized protein LOC124248923 isoform X2 [Equus quagga]|uniref:uncharacterized protein LOC124248923 isoform X2 n=1 Tax=Equus quagga TaxID=89248 RepID=UPI001EE19339|nr:uncharacterized protein LOC124248923 isoform X2 [Equus quagga]